jgi:hypothetical protein
MKVTLTPAYVHSGERSPRRPGERVLANRELFSAPEATFFAERFSASCTMLAFAVAR